MKLQSVTLLILTVFFSFQNKKESITRMNQPSISAGIGKIVPVVIDFKDTLLCDTLFIHYNSNKTPVKYSRPVVTSVCIDGKCRLVNIELFWNITGRYLGFKIPEGEFLSKTEHKPFNAKEYNRLHKLLSDPNSPLANYSLKELVPPIDSIKNKVDAVSSATIAAVLDYIVDGAVYTTYSLWHIANGSTKREVEKLSSKKLNSEMVLEILESENLNDKVWVLNHISGQMEITAELQSKLIKIISGDDIYLTERSLNALKPASLTPGLQLQLAGIFMNSKFIQKRLILQKLKEATNINTEITEMLSAELKTFNGTLVKTVLELYKLHNVKDDYTVSEITTLLKHENRYISKQAYKYLESLNTSDKKTLKALEKYKSKIS
jgi:hypothetical protein